MKGPTVTYVVTEKPFRCKTAAGDSGPPCREGPAARARRDPDG